MQQMRFIRWSVVTVIVVAGAVLFLSQPTIASNGATYSDPITIDVTAKHFVDYRRLDGVGDAVYYRVTVSKPTQANFQVSIPESAATKFAPQLVLFLPYSSTIGPLLPVIQPPKTLALVYPMTAPNTGFDALTQTSSTVRLQAKPNFPEAGTYTFAIYNAGQAAGQFKFFLNQGGHTGATWSDMWNWPQQWWRDQMFAGFSWMTLIVPLLVALSLWFVYLRLDHHQLHPHKTYIRKPTSRTNKKSS